MSSLYNYSWQHALLCYIAYFAMLVIAKPLQSYRNPRNNSLTCNINIFFFLLLLINVFSFWEYDTYHMWELFDNRNYITKYGVEAFEEIYNQLSIISGGRYFLWRFIIWGAACLLLYLTIVRLELKNRHALTALALFVAFAGYSRVILGCSMLLFGCTLLYSSKHFYEKVMAVLFISTSYFFHKSMYVNLLFAALALFPINKRIFRLLVFAYPFLTAVTTYIINNQGFIIWFTGLGDDVGGYSMDGGYSYIDQERSIANITGLVTQIITMLPSYISIFYASRRIYTDNWLEDSSYKKTIFYLFKYCFITIYIASLFYFTETSSWIYVRFMNMAMYPLAIVLAFLWTQEKKYNIWTQSIIIIQLVGLFMVHFVRLYHGMGY